jgi:hypothetical protein
MRNKLIALLLMVFALSAVWADDKPNQEDPALRAPWETYPQALGAAFGEITGTGLHYHRWNKDVGFQVSGGIIYLPPEQATMTTLDYNIGTGFQWRVYGDVYSTWLAGSLYLFAGAKHRGYIPIRPVGETPTIGTYQAEVGAGGGIGVELVLFQHFSLPAEVGYGGTWTVTEPVLSEAFLVNLYGQVALRYRY